MKVGVIGLGNMGLGMATTLQKHQHQVTGFDLATQAQQAAVRAGIEVAPNMGSLLASSEVVILSLPKAAHVEAVCLDSAGIEGLGQAGLVVVDTTTSTAAVSQKVHQALAARQITFIDAPVSGGPSGAANGTMTMVVGASDADYERILPLLRDMSAVQVHVGGCGAGNVVKIGNNLLAAAHLITTAEAVSMAAKAGVAPEKFLAGINQGSGRSGVSEVSFPRWVLNQAFDSGFTMGLMRKDVGLAHDLIQAQVQNLPLSALVSQLWQQSQATLADGEDFNAIVCLTDPHLFGKEA